MPLIRSIKPVTPVVALLYGRESHYDVLRGKLSELFGPIELESPIYPFTFTNYYENAMGGHLWRRFLLFEWESNPETLADWKRSTNDLEEQLAHELQGEVQRPVNIDPGYITSGKLVLASTKDFAHRIYLRDGIFAEVTLHFQDGEWRSHAFTFPDFKSALYHEFLKQAREVLLKKSRAGQQVDDCGEMAMDV
jgi:hypothetical protein